MNIDKTILLIGACGSGKTWVMLEILNLLKTKPAKLKKNYFRIDQQRKIAIMGVYDNSTFQGSDRLSMAVAQDFNDLKNLQKKEQLIIIAEGDRFTNKTFINLFDPFIIKIKDDGAKGRKLRGSSQTERQIKSIQTRVNNIKENILVENSQQAFQLITKIIRYEKD